MWFSFVLFLSWQAAAETTIAQTQYGPIKGLGKALSPHRAFFLLWLLLFLLSLSSVEQRELFISTVPGGKPVASWWA
jgi:hypothetical protein